MKVDLRVAPELGAAAVLATISKAGGCADNWTDRRKLPDRARNDYEGGPNLSEFLLRISK